MKLQFKFVASLIVLVTFCVLPSRAQVTWYSYAWNPVITYAMEPTVIYDSTDQLYRMWFIKTGTGIVDAESPDGLNWFIGDSVVLSPGPIGAFDRYIHSLSVIKKDSTYIMYYSASTDGSTQVIGRAVSADGRHWQKNPGTPVLVPGGTGAWDSRAIAAPKLIFEDSTYKMWFAASNGVITGTGLATSPDGIVWTKHAGNPVLTVGAPGSYDANEAGLMALAKRESTYYMIYRSINPLNKMAYSLATSKDGLSWWKYPGNPVKRPGMGWDSYMIGSGTLIWIGARFDLWYGGSDGGSWYIGVAMDEFVPLAVREPGAEEPNTFGLKQNYPNPFNPATTIEFRIATSEFVTLTVFDLLGRQVSTLVNEVRSAGTHAVQFDAAKLASGVYYYRLTAGSNVETRKMFLVR